MASAVNDLEPLSDDEAEEGGGGGSSASLSFEQYDVILPRVRLEAAELAIMSERGPFTDDIPQFIECSFHDKQMLGEYFIASSSQHGRFFCSCLYFDENGQTGKYRQQWC